MTPTAPDMTNNPMPRDGMTPPVSRGAPLRTAAICLAVVTGMGAMAYGAVPLYRIFCQVTGFGGTTQQADAAPQTVLDRQVTVRFDASLAKGLDWQFKPAQHSVNVKVGEVGLAFYRAKNLSDHPVVGTASFNVTPLKAGSYFTKIDCFCFTDQRLEPGQEMDMPVQFFVDPEIAEDANLDDVTTITLSYTFHQAHETLAEVNDNAFPDPAGSGQPDANKSFN